MTGLDYLPAVARPRDEHGPETELERAKRLMLHAAEKIEGEFNENEWSYELRDCAEKMLDEDPFDQIVTILSRKSGKPVRFVKRVLKSKLGVTG